jgi:hypothetical protein
MHSARFVSAQRTGILGGRISYGILTLAYLALRAYAYSGLTPHRLPDTTDYVAVSEVSVFSAEFWAGIRPWTIPLLFKLVGHSPIAFVVAQAVISTICWFLLAVMVARSVRSHALQLVGFTTILAFSLAGPVLRWDALLLSESLSLSLLALCAALGLRLLEIGGGGTLAAFGVVAMLWIFTRDANQYVLALLAGGLLLARAARRAPAAATLTAALLVVACVAGQVSVVLSTRWMAPGLNVLAARVLPFPERVATFAEFGMPTSPEVLALAGHSTSDGYFTRTNAPVYEPFFRWFSLHGKSALMRFAVTHPEVSLLGPLYEWQAVAAPDDYAALDGVMPVPWGDWPARPTVLVVSAAVLGWLIVRHRPRPRSNWLAPITLLLLVAPAAIVSWNGDGGDYQRHALIPSVLLYVGIVWFAVSVADSALGPASRPTVVGRIDAPPA